MTHPVTNLLRAAHHEHARRLIHDARSGSTMTADETGSVSELRVRVNDGSIGKRDA
jgi:hypothetical protein